MISARGKLLPLIGAAAGKVDEPEYEQVGWGEELRKGMAVWVTFMATGDSCLRTQGN